MAFMILPREVRDKIYALSLISSSAIIVHSSKLTRTWQSDNDNTESDKNLRLVMQLQLNHSATRSSVQNLALGLLRCNRATVAEASSIFYGENAFSFVGDHDWIPIISWLRAIGKQNRAYLTNLEATVRRLSTSWQYSDGSGAQIQNFRNNEFWPRSTHFSQQETVPEGEVENINPAIETIFSILGQCECVSSPKLTLTLNLHFDLIPGVIIITETEDIETSYFSMDLPNLMEKWRVNYTSGRRSRLVEVLWKAESFRKETIEKRELIKQQGWEIMKEEETERLRIVKMNPREYGPCPTMKFTLSGATRSSRSKSVVLEDRTRSLNSEESMIGNQKRTTESLGRD